MADRNPERVLAALAAYLRTYPESRVGQAVANHLPERCENDPFYVGDDELADALERSARGEEPTK